MFGATCEEKERECDRLFFKYCLVSVTFVLGKKTENLGTNTLKMRFVKMW